MLLTTARLRQVHILSGADIILGFVVSTAVEQLNAVRRATAIGPYHDPVMAVIR